MSTFIDQKIEQYIEDHTSNELEILKNGFAYAYDEKGDEIINVPVTEQIYSRPAFDEKYGTSRNNTP